VADDTILYDPFEKIELGDSCRDAVKCNALGSTKWIKELLGIPVEARLVRDVDRKHLAVRADIGHVLILRIIRDEPLNLAKGDAVSVVQDIIELVSIFLNVKKLGQTRQEDGRFTHYL